jgi:hypothetical protein
LITAPIRRILENSGARRAAGDGDLWFLEIGPWWKLFLDLKGMEQTKEAILSAAWQLPMPLYFLPERPLDPDLMPFVEAVGDAWRINRARPATQFYGTEPASGMGNWHLYAAEKPVTDVPPDAFRSTPQELLEYLKRQHVVLWIDCFHDDTDWCVAVREPVPNSQDPA